MKDLIQYSNQLYLYASQYYGEREVPGKESNQTILGWLKDIFPWVDNEIAWCSAFMNAMAKANGLEHPTEKAGAARSWLNVGLAVTDGPVIGDVCVFWRESPKSWKGHVGLFVRETEKFIWVLGGNQSDQVNIRPYTKSRLLSIRRLIPLEDEQA